MVKILPGNKQISFYGALNILREFKLAFSRLSSEPWPMR